MSASGCGSECVGGVSPAAPAWGAAPMRLRVGGAAPWRRRSGRSGRLCTDSPGTCSSSWPQSEQYSQPMTTREVPPAAPSPRTGDWDSPGTWWEGAGGRGLRCCRVFAQPRTRTRGFSTTDRGGRRRPSRPHLPGPQQGRRLPALLGPHWQQARGQDWVGRCLQETPQRSFRGR